MCIRIESHDWRWDPIDSKNSLGIRRVKFDTATIKHILITMRKPTKPASMPVYLTGSWTFAVAKYDALILAKGS